MPTGILLLDLLFETLRERCGGEIAPIGYRIESHRMEVRDRDFVPRTFEGGLCGFRHRTIEARRLVMCVNNEDAHDSAQRSAGCFHSNVLIGSSNGVCASALVKLDRSFAANPTRTSSA